MSKSDEINKKLIVVLGSHRSGTSLVAGGLAYLGVSLGKELLKGSEENLKGYFENPVIINFNDRLLSFLGGRWDNPLFNGELSIRSKPKAELDVWYKEGIEIIESHYAGDILIAIKDPRICQLLPFWCEVFSQCGYDESDIYFIHMVRHPMEVANSQYIRKQKNDEFYFLGNKYMEMVCLWFSMTCQSINSISSDNNIFISYAGLVSQPLLHIKKIAEFLGIETDKTMLDEFCNEFVNPELKRSIYTGEEDLLLKKEFHQAYTVYESLCSLANKDSVSRFDLLEVSKICDLKCQSADLLKPIVPLISEMANQRIIHIQNIKSDSDKFEKLKLQYLEGIVLVIQNIKSDSDKFEKLKLQYLEGIALVIQNIKSDSDKFEKLKSKYLEGIVRVENLQEECDYMKRSWSWRITTPLRYLNKVRSRGVSSVYDVWLKFRKLMVAVNYFLKKRFPILANILFIIAKPIINSTDRQVRKLLYVNKSAAGGSLQGENTYVSRFQKPVFDRTFMPLVSIIVPNYNHAEFLEKRLESIYSQTYPLFEVILLDDCSQDGSQDILKSYLDKYSENTRLIINDVNSGGVFNQWDKGISLARGDLIWIAESDDWCSDNFLKELTGYFVDEAVMLSYARTEFVDGDTEDQIWTIEEFLSDVSEGRWGGDFIRSSHYLVNKYWSIKNIVPNVSSALFRRPNKGGLFDSEDWKSMRICGDWVFYLHMVRGGLVAYTTKATNYYRIHKSNTSIATYKKDIYYKEHEIVALTVNRLYKVPQSVFLRQKEVIKQHWIENRDDYTDEKLSEYYDVSKILTECKKRKPNIAMTGYAFAAGGGETFPIQLANLLKELDYAVTFINFDQEEEVEGVRRMLRSDIPVMNNFFCLRDIVNDLSIDIIHSHHAWVDNTIIDLLSKDTACQHVVSLHGMYEMLTTVEQKEVIPRVIRNVSKLVYTADKNLASFEKSNLYDYDQFIKIGNSLDVKEINPVDMEELGIGEDAFVLCLVSRAIPEKGWKEAISAVEMARKISGNDINLLLIGEGPEYDSLKGIDKTYIHFLGFRSNIRDFYASSDIGLLPSRFKGESYPLTLIDCFMSGRPVLASSLGEIPVMVELNGYKAGHLFNLNNFEIPVDEVANGIARLSSDKAYYKELHDAVSHVVKRFDSSRMIGQYDRVYMDLYQGNSDCDLEEKAVN